MFLCVVLALPALVGAAAREVRQTSPRARDSHTDTSLRGSWNKPEFFDAFSVGESTWDYDGAQPELAKENPFHNYAGGYNPQLSDPFDPKEVAPAWFEESQSAGSEQALQTNWPQVSRGPASHGISSGEWYQNDAGVWVQSYKYPVKWAESSAGAAQSTGNIAKVLSSAGTKPAGWFDASVNQYDAYGRPKDPYPGNPANLLLHGYTQKAVNTSVACQQPGCNATAQLSLAKAGEEVRNCRLSVQVKPTDFGKGKVVEFISVNNVNVSVGCTPISAAGKCSSEEVSDLSQLFTCVENIDVEHLLSEDGSLTVAAKISNGVNSSECAYEGNLLYAIPQVTCLVGTPPPPFNLSHLESRPDSQPVFLSNLQQAEVVKKQGRQARLQVKRH